MSELTDKALEWLGEVVTLAFSEAQQGDTVRLNQLGYHPGAQYYINNVHGRLPAVMVQWKQYHPEHLRDVERLYEAYLQAEAQQAAAEKVAALENRVAELAAFVQKLTEAQAEPEPAPAPDAPVEPVAVEEPKRKGKKSGSAEAAEPSVEPAAEGDKKEEAE